MLGLPAGARQQDMSASCDLPGCCATEWAKHHEHHDACYIQPCPVLTCLSQNEHLVCNEFLYHNIGHLGDIPEPDRFLALILSRQWLPSGIPGALAALWKCRTSHCKQPFDITTTTRIVLNAASSWTPEHLLPALTVAAVPADTVDHQDQLSALASMMNAHQGLWQLEHLTLVLEACVKAINATAASSARDRQYDLLEMLFKHCQQQFNMPFDINSQAAAVMNQLIKAAIKQGSADCILQLLLAKAPHWTPEYLQDAGPPVPLQSHQPGSSPANYYWVRDCPNYASHFPIIIRAAADRQVIESLIPHVLYLAQPLQRGVLQDRDGSSSTMTRLLAFIKCLAQQSGSLQTNLSMANALVTAAVNTRNVALLTALAINKAKLPRNDLLPLLKTAAGGSEEYDAMTTRCVVMLATDSWSDLELMQALVVAANSRGIQGAKQLSAVTRKMFEALCNRDRWTGLIALAVEEKLALVHKLLLKFQAANTQQQQQQQQQQLEVLPGRPVTYRTATVQQQPVTPQDAAADVPPRLVPGLQQKTPAGHDPNAAATATEAAGQRPGQVQRMKNAQSPALQAAAAGVPVWHVSGLQQRTAAGSSTGAVAASGHVTGQLQHLMQQLRSSAQLAVNHSQFKVPRPVHRPPAAARSAPGPGSQSSGMQQQRAVITAAPAAANVQPATAAVDVQRAAAAANPHHAYLLLTGSNSGPSAAAAAGGGGGEEGRGVSGTAWLSWGGRRYQAPGLPAYECNQSSRQPTSPSAAQQPAPGQGTAAAGSGHAPAVHMHVSSSPRTIGGHCLSAAQGPAEVAGAAIEHQHEGTAGGLTMATGATAAQSEAEVTGLSIQQPAPTEAMLLLQLASQIVEQEENSAVVDAAGEEAIQGWQPDDTLNMSPYSSKPTQYQPQQQQQEQREKARIEGESTGKPTDLSSPAAAELLDALTAAAGAVFGSTGNAASGAQTAVQQQHPLVGTNAAPTAGKASTDVADVGSAATDLKLESDAAATVTQRPSADGKAELQKQPAAATDHSTPAAAGRAAAEPCQVPAVSASKQTYQACGAAIQPNGMAVQSTVAQQQQQQQQHQLCRQDSAAEAATVLTAMKHAQFSSSPTPAGPSSYTALNTEAEAFVAAAFPPSPYKHARTRGTAKRVRFYDAAAADAAKDGGRPSLAPANDRSRPFPAEKLAAGVSPGKTIGNSLQDSMLPLVNLVPTRTSMPKVSKDDLADERLPSAAAPAAAAKTWAGTGSAEGIAGSKIAAGPTGGTQHATAVLNLSRLSSMDAGSAKHRQPQHQQQQPQENPVAGSTSGGQAPSSSAASGGGLGMASKLLLQHKKSIGVPISMMEKKVVKQALLQQYQQVTPTQQQQQQQQGSVQQHKRLHVGLDLRRFSEQDGDDSKASAQGKKKQKV